jgi:hypothetical protein
LLAHAVCVQVWWCRADFSRGLDDIVDGLWLMSGLVDG